MTSRGTWWLWRVWILHWCSAFLLTRLGIRKVHVRGQAEHPSSVNLLFAQICMIPEDGDGGDKPDKRWGVLAAWWSLFIRLVFQISFSFGCRHLHWHSDLRTRMIRACINLSVRTTKSDASQIFSRHFWYPRQSKALVLPAPVEDNAKEKVCLLGNTVVTSCCCCCCCCWWWWWWWFCCGFCLATAFVRCTRCRGDLFAWLTLFHVLHRVGIPLKVSLTEWVGTCPL